MHALALTRQAICSSKFNFYTQKNRALEVSFSTFVADGLVFFWVLLQMSRYLLGSCLLASRYGKMKAVFYLIHMGSSTMERVKTSWRAKLAPKIGGFSMTGATKLPRRFTFTRLKSQTFLAQKKKHARS